MQTQDSALLLLLACCLWSAEAQRQSWNDPIKFKTKANDLCSMTITGQREYTRLRMSCQSSKRSYWCEYIGTPYICQNYNRNPRHYFLQMMWGLRKLPNACQAPKQIKPRMCRRAADDSQMVFSSASFSRPPPETPAPTSADPAEVTPPVKTTPRASPTPVTPPVESEAKRMAQQYCWRSLQGICSYFIGLFRKK